jgi:glycolate oxidase
LGAGCGWFCGEGPGPSLRGIVRGKFGATGGLGVYTKCAVKLSPWPGPPELPVEGVAPCYKSPLPDNARSYTVAFPDWQSFATSYYKLWDSEIGYIAHRQFNVFGSDLQYAFLKMYTDPTKTLSDMEEMVKRPEIKKVTEEMRISYQIVLAGNSKRDFEYQEKVLDKILADTGGWKVKAMSEPDMEKFTYLYLIRLGHKNLNHVYTGGAGCSVTQMATPTGLIAQLPTQIQTLAEYQENGLLVKAGGDSLMGCVGPTGGGNYSLLEQFHYYDPHEPESIKASIKFKQEARNRLKSLGFSTSAPDDLIIMGVNSREEFENLLLSSPQPILPYIQGRIKKAFDPNDTGGITYVYSEKQPEVH